MYISIKWHSWFFKSWWCLLYFGHVQTRTAGKCWLQKTPFCLKLSTHAQKSVLSWSISISRILGCTYWKVPLENTLSVCSCYHTHGKLIFNWRWLNIYVYVRGLIKRQLKMSFPCVLYVYIQPTSRFVLSGGFLHLLKTKTKNKETKTNTKSKTTKNKNNKKQQQNKTKQKKNKTKQNKTKQNKTKQNKNKTKTKKNK